MPVGGISWDLLGKGKHEPPNLFGSQVVERSPLRIQAWKALLAKPTYSRKSLLLETCEI